VIERRRVFPRKLADVLVKGASALAALLGIAVLAWILVVVIERGAAAINWSFFTSLPGPPGGEGGGLASAILGTLMMTLIATALAVPVGILAGVYLAEFGHENRFGHSVRFLANVLMGIPSIIIGLFIYGLIVVPTGGFSGLAGAVALAVLILPMVARTTEDMLGLVPNAFREAALALGAPRWKVTLSVVMRAARVGVLTGVLLAVARVSGETAPLLFTALNSPYWPTSLTKPTANLTVTIFNYAMSPYPNWQQAAWGASLLITAAILLVTLSARLVVREVGR
jgi:phosphate transport system permease protein